MDNVFKFWRVVMPHIRLRGLSSEQITNLNVPLIKELSAITESPENHFTFEHVQTNFFVEGKLSKGEPFIEVLWFARDQQVQDACAKVITNKIKMLTPDKDVTVIFIELSKISYYENGEHF